MMPVALEIPPTPPPSPHPQQNTLPTYAPIAEILFKRNEAFYSIMLKVQIILGEVTFWFKCSKTCRWLMMGFSLGADSERRDPSDPHRVMDEGKSKRKSCWSIKIFAYLYLPASYWTCHWIFLPWPSKDHDLAYCLMHHAYLLGVTIESFKPVLSLLSVFMESVGWRSGEDHTMNSVKCGSPENGWFKGTIFSLDEFTLNECQP